MNSNPTIYRDSLLSASSLVVDHDGHLWIVPNVAGGWERRLPLTLSPEARADRLIVVDVGPAWLGIVHEDMALLVEVGQQ